MRRDIVFAAETQGSVDADWFAALDWLVLSPKPPSSAMATDWIAMDACLGVAGSKPRCVLKVVVFDDVDYGFAREAAERYPELPIYLQVGNPAPLNSTRSSDAPVDEDDLRRRLQWLIGKVADDRWFAATVLPQLHVLIWGNKRRSIEGFACGIVNRIQHVSSFIKECSSPGRRRVRMPHRSPR